MGKSSTWVNNDGLVVGFGARTVEDKYPGTVEMDGSVEEIILDFAYDDLPTFDANNGAVMSIPANAQIVEATLYVKTAAAGGTDYTIGLYQPNGTAIDADGLVTALDAPVASLTAGAYITGSGALVGASIGSAAGQITVTANGAFTAGEYRLFVKYRLPRQ